MGHLPPSYRTRCRTLRHPTEFIHLQKVQTIRMVCPHSTDLILMELLLAHNPGELHGHAFHEPTKALSRAVHTKLA